MNANTSIIKPLGVSPWNHAAKRRVREIPSLEDVINVAPAGVELATAAEVLDALV